MNFRHIIRQSPVPFSILVTCIVFSSFSISFVRFSEISNILMVFSILGPGILFSVIIMSQRNIQDKPLKAFGLFLTINIFWISAFIMTLYSWGIATPFIGAFTAHRLIKMTSKTDVTNKKSFNSIILLGGTTSLVGVILFYAANNFMPLGISMIGVVALWQFVVGVKVIELNQTSA